MEHSSGIPFIVVLVSSLIAAGTDVWKFKVHNALTLPLLVSALVYHRVVGGPPALVNSLLGLLFGFGVLLILYVLGGMGAGDVKFMAAVGAWVGWPLVLCIFVAGSLAAAIYGVILLVLFGNFRVTWVNLQILWHRCTTLGRHLVAEDRVETEVLRADRRQRLIPFTAMVALGVIVSLLVGMVLRSAGGTPHVTRPGNAAAGHVQPGD